LVRCPSGVVVGAVASMLWPPLVDFECITQTPHNAH
jgi:hypothetical protein